MSFIDLSGKWNVSLDEEKNSALPSEFPYEIQLPNTTSNAKIGKLNTNQKYGCLTDRYEFEGYAWFERSFTVDGNNAGKKCVLFLERTRKTAVWLDGQPLGEYCSLCTPHRYELPLMAAGEHRIIIRVDNTDYPTGGGHLTSQDTQTNWNGITGKIGLEFYSALPEACSLFPDPQNALLKIRAIIRGESEGSAVIRISDSDGEYACEKVSYQNQLLECTLKLADGFPLWSEHSPKLLRLEINTGTDKMESFFGMRKLTAEGLKFKINGNETFLRGKHDGLIFPKTGFAPTDTTSWIKVFEIAKRYGINHYRFHTCCPPDAAFEAADLMGIYMQPELPFWGTIPDEFGEEHEFLREEGFRILREYGRHPSFVMMSMGNELWGSKERLEELLAGYKKYDSDKLYVQGSNNYQFVPCILDNDDFFSGVRFDRDRLIRGSYAACDAPFGHIQTQEPNSTYNYDMMIVPQKALGGSNGGEILIQYGTEMKKVSADSSDAIIPNVPVVSHEVGQYYTYPDYDEIVKYTGSLKHDTYEGYRETAKEKGLLPYAKNFFRSSGALSAQCYRLEIETAMRSANLAGFQLLDLQDFTGQGTATVGILDAFMESKGLIEPSDWRAFCGKTVVLAAMDKFVYTCGETVNCGLMISSTEPNYSANKINWRLVKERKAISSGSSIVGKFEGRIAHAEDIEFTFESDKPKKVTLELQVDGTNVINTYPLWFYPNIDVIITEEYIEYNGTKLMIYKSPDEARANGGLCIPKAPKDALAGEYCTDFWCYGMFKSISESMGKPVPTGTLGLCIDNKSELLDAFPCEKHTTPPWYSIIKHSHCANLDSTDIVPDIWVIDNPLRASRLALLYRDNGACVCTSRLWEIANRIEVKTFAASLVNALCKDKVQQQA